MKWCVCVLMICVSCWVKSQGIFQLHQDKPVSFKFELVNNIVLVPLRINGIPFSFLLDTGVEETILFANTTDSLYLKNQRKVVFRGIGTEDGVEGILSRGNIVEVGGAAIDSLHWIYVVQGDELDISSHVGVAVNGILGSKFFHSFTVQMNYQKERITLFPSGYNYERKIRKYDYIPLEIDNDRPYLEVRMQIDTAVVAGKMLLDMGNTDPLMLFAHVLPNVQIKEPFVDEYIGQGFNGAVYGKRNRIRKLDVGAFTLNYPIVSYPDSNALFMSKLAKNRIGSVGNQVLQRFHVWIDYQKKALYLRKNRKFSKPFFLNMAGIDIRHDGMVWTKEWTRTEDRDRSEERRWNQGVTINMADATFQYKFVLQPAYKISGVRKHSPAAEAGVQPGDMLLTVNGRPAGRLSLPRIMDLLQSSPGETIRLTLERDGEAYDAHFRLVDPIPF